MIEPEIKSYLDKFDERLQAIQYKREGLWHSFFRGIMTGLGYVVGIVLALAIAGYILNAVGVIPAFKQQAASWQQTLDNIYRTR